MIRRKRREKPRHSDKYWWYRGKCQNCGETTDRLITKDQKFGHDLFVKHVIDNCYPQYTAYCTRCHNAVVFDLVAYSKGGNNED